MNPFQKNIITKLDEILLKLNSTSLNFNNQITQKNILTNNPETFISLGGNCYVAHMLLLAHRKFSLPFDSFGCPDLKSVIDVIENVNNGTFDYDSFFEPSLKHKNCNNTVPIWSMVHWIPDFKTIKDGGYNKEEVIEKFKRRFERLFSLKDEPQNFVYLVHRDQVKVKKLSEVLEQAQRLASFFKIKQFIYLSNITLTNDVTEDFKNTTWNDDAQNYHEINPHLNAMTVKWKNTGIPKWFKYYCSTNLSISAYAELCLKLKSLNFYEETGIIEQTEKINKYIQSLKIV